MKVQPIPTGYNTITPYLLCKESVKVLDFLKNAFDAQVVKIMLHDDQSIANAEIKIGNSMIMLAEAMGEWPPLPAMIYMYVENTDELYEKAIANGATSVMPPMDMFYGDRNAGVKDPGGNQWWIATHIEDVSDEEMNIRKQQHQKRS